MDIVYRLGWLSHLCIHIPDHNQHFLMMKKRKRKNKATDLKDSSGVPSKTKYETVKLYTPPSESYPSLFKFLGLPRKMDPFSPPMIIYHIIICLITLQYSSQFNRLFVLSPQRYCTRFYVRTLSKITAITTNTTNDLCVRVGRGELSRIISCIAAMVVHFITLFIVHMCISLPCCLFVRGPAWKPAVRTYLPTPLS